jgi:hypothetical protein
MSDYQHQEEQETWDAIARTDPSEFIGTVPYDGTVASEVLATEKQVMFLEDLRRKKDLSLLSPEQIAWVRDADFTKVPKKRASDVIGKLIDLPHAREDNPSTGTMMYDVPDGRYAIPKDDGTLMFYSVKKGTHVTFVDVWASDARWPVKNRDEISRILNAISLDPDAGPRFGREIGRCYVCGRTLTDESSRAAGIGPICAAGA